MKKVTKITDKEILKDIQKVSYYDVERFCKDAIEYATAIKEGRVICSIGHVSSSGMSRTIKFLECRKHKGENRYQYMNFYAFFLANGFKKASGRYEQDYFTIGGCGMDMIFHTNYTIIHRLRRLGFLSQKECEKLAQMTPSTI